MDVRLQALQAHLAAARAALDAGESDRAGEELSKALAIDPECTAAHALRERLEEAKSASARNLPPVPAGESVPAGEPVRPIVSVEGFARFEERARRRRIERRSEAARDAIARGRLHDAAAAIQEIRELDDDAPEVAVLTTAVGLASARDRAGARRFGGPRAAGLAAFATIILGATLLEQTHRLMSYPIVPAIVAPLAPRSAAPAPESPAPATEPTAAATSAVVVTDSVVIPAAELTPAAPVAAPAPPPATVRQPAPPPQTRPQTMPPALTPLKRQAPIAVTTVGETRKVAPPVAEASNPGPPPAPPPVRIAPPAVVASMEPVPVPTTPPLRPPSPSPTPAATTPVAPTTLASAASVPPPSLPADVPAPRPSVDDEGLIRHALQQYRSAYEDLNAQSARAVWPAVNERALARAFDGLESQHLTFDACDVQVHGESALATCHGSAQYVAKIGSREPRTEPRVWTFALRKADASWKIQNARAER